MTSQEINFREQRVQRLVDYLPNLIYGESVPMDIQATTDPEPIPFGELSERSFRAMQEGEVWGKTWGSAWLRLRSEVPADWAGKTVVARINVGGEACVFSPEGNPLQGLTSGSLFGHTTRERYPLFSPCRGGETVELLIEAAANDLFGITRDAHPIPGKPYSEGKESRLECVRLAVFNEEMFHLWLDVSVLYPLMKSLPERDPQRAQLLHQLTKATSAFDYGLPNAREVRDILAPSLQKKGDETRLATTATGHAHIDTGWLWPVRESIRKCARTFSSQLRLSEKYEGYVFGASAAQHYQFVKDHYPALYKEIREAIADGRWEIQGAMWVEADNNVISGESLVRQVLYGKKFFQDEFGVDVRNLWLPDVFGYAASLPQILRKAGVDTFLTQKISWSQFNKFPHHTFIWRGIDGTEILTHFPPEDTYNSVLAPERVRYSAENFEERGYLPEFLTVFGIGDGGGGPTEESIEAGLRQQNLAGCPRVSFGKAQDMFDRLKDHEAEMSLWNGELYLELHRGTLTTQARTKRMNRLCELHLRRTEMLSSCLPFDQYPQAEIERAWKLILTNQFHDIIPGSSIKEVYETALEEYTEVQETLNELDNAAAETLRSDSGTAGAVTILNSLTDDVCAAVHLPAVEGTAIKSGDGQLLPVQPDGQGGGWVDVEVGGLSGESFTFADKGDSDAADGAGISTKDGLTVMENASVRYEIDGSGRVCRILDKESGREAMRPGELGNVLSLYEDWPYNWDAWEVDITYEQQLRETARLVSSQVTAEGPVLAELTLEFAVGQSTIRQKVRLGAQSARLDFATEVDWSECRRMLRASFAVDVAAPEATYEIQFGTYRRPTHRNTSWDMAKFEVCGHRFVDLSDQTHGVALLNDCKYGHKVHENVLDLNLLRSPFHPDPTADRHRHEITYAILPHEGRLEESCVVSEAHALNQPPLVLEGEVAFTPPCRIVGDGVVLDTLKKAEREDAWIVRLYEPLGVQSQCELQLSDPSIKVWEAGIMEDACEQVSTQDGTVQLQLSPFEIRTLILRP